MSDFVFEVRPRPQYRNNFTPVSNTSDFVASFGCPSKTVAPITRCQSPSSDSCIPRCESENSTMFLSPHSPYISDSFCSYPSPRHEDMSASCDGYSKEEVFDMVSSKQLSKSQTKNILEDSILVLTERLLHGRPIARIEGIMTITLIGDAEPIEVNLKKLYSAKEQDLVQSLKMKEDIPNRVRDSPSSVSSEEWMDGFGPEHYLRADERQSVSSPAMYSPGAPSDNDREPTKNVENAFNNQDNSDNTDQLKTRREKKEVFVDEVQTEDEDCTESALVIDIPSDDLETEQATPKNNEKDDVMESESDDSGLEVNSNSSDSYSDELEDSDESSTGKSVAPNGLEDAPGDSSLSREPLVMSKSHSLIWKFSDGMKCNKCHQTLTDAEAVAKHAMNNHSLYCCTYCFKTFTAKNNLKRHVRLHTGLRPYNCTQCSQKFARRDDLKGHMLRHDYNKPYRCSVCRKGYTDKACVKNHMAREHGSRRLIVCPQCGESFDNEDGFSDHKKTHPELNKFACKDCSFIGINKLMKMKHMLIHSHKLFSCKPCNAYFSDPFSYTSHVRSHKASQSYTEYTCCFCDLVLPSYDQFVRHEYSHAQGKTYSCDICSKQFNSKAAVQEHSRCHEEVHQQDMASDNQEMEHNLEKPCLSIPKIVLNEPENQACDDLTCDGVLDLSIRKQSVSSAELSQLNMEQGQNVSSGVTPASMLCGPTEYSAPRDGCTSGSPASGRANVITSQVLPLFSTVERTEEAVFRPVFKTNNSEKPVESIPNFLAIPSDSVSSIRPQSAEDTQSDRSERKDFLLIRSLSSQNRGQSRFSPYNKIADFTQKFIAARGGQQALFKKGRPVLKPVSREMPNQTASLAPMWQFERVSVCEQTDIKKVIPEEYCGEKDIFENSQLPTFIKSEPFFETSSNVSSTSQHAVDKNGPSMTDVSSTLRDVSQVCEQCKEEFGSFPELENHSVNVHKRYLCEHCGKSFSARPNRDRHVRYHTGERPYKCDLCDQAFFRGDDLKYHRTTRHPTAMPFVCNSCSATFTWKKDLERHIRQSKCKL